MRAAGIIFLLHLIAASGFAQENAPKIGLVLSGGGAKGLAHIGVLRVLEEVGIYPDYITGTSMGAVVGGLYATGYSAAELDSIARTVNWDVLLSNATRYSNVAIQEKPYYGKHQITLPIDKSGISLPQGLIESQELSNLLIRLTAPVHDVSDFDSLPRPFRCFAANIENGEKVMLREGSLATAIRASMAIPSVFTPVELNGKLLVDGGIVHNFPAEEVIDMGADIVIGVSVSDSLNAVDDLGSLTDILTQAAFITSVKNASEQRIFVDYYIRPKTKPYTTASFNDTDSIIVRGEKAARQQYETLKELADSLRMLRTFEAIAKPPVEPEFRVDTVNILGNGLVGDRLIEGKLGIEPGDRISLDYIEERVDRIFGTRYFDGLTYELDNANRTLNLQVRESSPGRASFNLHYDSENGVGLQTTLAILNFGIKGSRFTVDADIAEVPYVHTEYFVHLGEAQETALSIGARFFNDDIPSFDINGNRESTYGSNLWNYFATLQRIPRVDRSYGIQFYGESMRLKPKVSAADDRLFSLLTSRTWGLRAFYHWNTLSDRSFPTHGLRLNVAMRWVFSQDARTEDPQFDPEPFLPEGQLWSADAFYEQYFSLTSRLVLFTQHAIRLTNQETDKFNFADFSYAGGFKPNFINSIEFLGASKYEYILTSHYKAALGLRYEPARSLFLTLAVNYLETEYPMDLIAGDYFDNADLSGQDRRLALYLEGAWLTRLGPIKLSLAHDVDRKKYLLFLSLGYNFRNAFR